MNGSRSSAVTAPWVGVHQYAAGLALALWRQQRIVPDVVPGQVAATDLAGESEIEQSEREVRGSRVAAP